MADYKIAIQQLFIGYALAHSPGDQVPAENVARNGWEDGVANPGTKAANEAQNIAESDGPPVAATASPAPK